MEISIGSTAFAILFFSYLRLLRFLIFALIFFRKLRRFWLWGAPTFPHFDLFFGINSLRARLTT
jgi:hypothetical protein